MLARDPPAPLCFLAFFEEARPDAAIATADLGRVREIVAGLAGLAKAHLYTPARAHDPHGAGQAAPFFGLQLYFDELAGLEAAAAAGGPLEAVAALPSLVDAIPTQEAMRGVSFVAPGPAPLAATACSYCVHYPGPAADPDAWHRHYVARHVPLMAELPGVREVEVLRPLAWRSGLRWRRAVHMLRNRVLFDSAPALDAALASPVRHAMRDDFAAFPPYEGGAFHFPFATQAVHPRRQAI
ncbi:MAG TPA: EthD family reductase [Hyphomicrobiales bacterium]|nr:EthD family reductase [Hyphomicrobiales bacterium]